MTAPRMKGTFVVLAICYPDYEEIRLTVNLNRPHEMSIYSPQSTPISSRESQIRTARCVRSPAMFIDMTVNLVQGQSTTYYIYPQPRRRFTSQRIFALSAEFLQQR